MGAAFGVILGVASKIFYVDTDPRISEVREVLPGANCGGCGKPGCDALAEAVVNGTMPVNGCPVGGADVAAKVAKILGQEVVESVKKVAYVTCNGTKENCKPKYEYYGLEDCLQAANVLGGSKACAFGCLGYGSCVKACQFDAIHIDENGLARVDKDKCTSCGACIKTCPKSVIRLVEYDKQVDVVCNSKDRAKAVREICKVGCIACQACVKNCPEKAIVMENNLPVIDAAKCVKCGKCAEKCPQKSITVAA
jgi:Na+-translocating ferredoxin:NAD+ oxidoreductase RNF subunit RnfB